MQKMNPKLEWDVLAFRSEANEQSLRQACAQVGAQYLDYEVTPTFRYVIQATLSEMQRIQQLVPWAKDVFPSYTRHMECVLEETTRE